MIFQMIIIVDKNFQYHPSLSRIYIGTYLCSLDIIYHRLTTDFYQLQISLNKSILVGDINISHRT